MLRRWVKPLVGLMVTILFLWLLFQQVEANQLRAAFSAITPSRLLLALLFLGLGYAFRILRWWWMLRKLDPAISLSACGWPFLTSIAVNNLLPFRAGDAFRVMGFRQQLEAPAMRLLASLVVERLLDLLTLLGLFYIGLQGVKTGVMPEQFLALISWITVAAIMVLLGLLMLPQSIRRWVDWLASRPLCRRYAWSCSLSGHTRHFLEVLHLLRSPRLILQLVLLSLLVWGFEGLMYMSIVRGAQVDTSAAAPWFALSTGTLATLLPSTPGYLGTFDYFAMLGLQGYGVNQTAATAFALQVHLVLWLPLTLVGLTYFLLPGTVIFNGRLKNSASGSKSGA